MVRLFLDRRCSRRTVLRGLSALPAAMVACAAPAGTSQPVAVKVAPGKVMVMSYQTSSPKLDMQIANYEELKKEFAPRGIEVDFVNSGAPSNDALMVKLTTMHVSGTPHRHVGVAAPVAGVGGPDR